MTTVHVKGISSQTSEKEVRDFFSFCGKIQTLSVKPDSNSSDASQSAGVTFEKESAAKTALLLDNTQLGPAQVHVTSAASLDDLASNKTFTSPEDAAHDGENIAQEDKPRARVLAEYLAHGYVVSDNAIARAIQLDQQHGVSSRFMTTLNNFDNKLGVSEKTAQMDQKFGVSASAHKGWLGLSSYFDRASSTPTGQKLRAFYDQSQKQVMDVHNEARHLASLKSEKQGGEKGGCACGADTGKCGCAPGKCSCKDCPKNPEVSTTSRTAEEAEMEKVQVEGQEKTKCNCGGKEGACPCEPGKCACTGCSKAS